MRFAIGLAVLLVSASAEAQRSSTTLYRSSGGGWSSPRCQLDPPRDCGLVAVSAGLGVLSSLYLGVYVWNRDRPGLVHAGGAIAGGLSLAVGAGFAIDSKLKQPHQQLAAGFAILTGAPALILGLHALVTGDEARDEQKPTTLPSWYGSQYMRVDVPLPATFVDARGAPFPGLSMSGAFL